MRERLRKIPQVFAALAQLLRIKSHVVRIPDHLLEEYLRFFQLPRPRQRSHTRRYLAYLLESKRFSPAIHKALKDVYTLMKRGEKPNEKAMLDSFERCLRDQPLDETTRRGVAPLTGFTGHL